MENNQEVVYFFDYFAFNGMDVIFFRFFYFYIFFNLIFLHPLLASNFFFTSGCLHKYLLFKLDGRMGMSKDFYKMGKTYIFVFLCSQAPASGLDAFSM